VRVGVPIAMLYFHILLQSNRHDNGESGSALMLDAKMTCTSNMNGPIEIFYNTIHRHSAQGNMPPPLYADA